jgi:hypothetical protein
VSVGSEIIYTVRADFADAAVGARWLAWVGPHAEDVIAAGALAAQVVRHADGRSAEVHYRFASAAAFEAYLRDHAPRLRADGLRHFPAGSGVTLSRRHGELVFATG